MVSAVGVKVVITVSEAMGVGVSTTTVGVSVFGTGVTEGAVVDFCVDVD